MSDKVKMLNVPRSVTDEFYRYKMPDMILKIEGKGNGIKTVIVNCDDIAKALGTSSAYICRYFGFVLAAAVNTDSGKYIVNGKHEYKDMMNTLDKFIDKFILCKKCNNPETVMHVKDKMLNLHCKACGHITVVPKGEKLVKYIVAHPPKRDNMSDEEDIKEEKEEEINPFDERRVVIILKKHEGEDEKIEMKGKEFSLEKLIEMQPGNRFNAMLKAYKQCYHLSTKTLMKQLFDVVFDKDIISEFTTKVNYFDNFLGDAANEKGMMAFLDEFIMSCVKYDLVNDDKTIDVFLCLYNSGLVVKSVFLKWFDGGSIQMSPMKPKAKEFIDYLQNEKSEDDEEEDDEEEEEEEEEDDE